MATSAGGKSTLSSCWKRVASRMSWRWSRVFCSWPVLGSLSVRQDLSRLKLEPASSGPRTIRVCGRGGVPSSSSLAEPRWSLSRSRAALDVSTQTRTRVDGPADDPRLRPRRGRFFELTAEPCLSLSHSGAALKSLPQRSRAGVSPAASKTSSAAARPADVSRETRRPRTVGVCGRGEVSPSSHPRAGSRQLVLLTARRVARNANPRPAPLGQFTSAAAAASPRAD